MAAVTATQRPPGFITALRGSGAAAPFVASLIGRLPMGAVGLVFILRTNEITGSFALGGLATAAYALSLGVLAPAMGRLIDLKGQTRVLLGCGVVYAAALTLFAALPDDAGVAPILALAALTGASQPPLGATVRALWNQTLDDPATRHVLFTGESAVLEAIYIAGPVLIVAGIGGLISIPAAALACGVFGLLGTLMFAATAASRAWRPAPDRVRRARRRARLPRRAHAARRRCWWSAPASASSRSPCPRCARRPDGPAPPASCSACGGWAASSGASWRAACRRPRIPGGA